MYARGRGATAEEIRSHLVRGHFKVRKTGIFWWRPHTAGRGGPPIEKLQDSGLSFRVGFIPTARGKAWGACEVA